MKSFTKGFLKGILGCVIVLAFSLAFCHFTGMFDGLSHSKDTETTVAEAELVPERDSKVSLESLTEECTEAKDKGTELTEESEADLESEAEEEKEIRMLFSGDVYLPESHQTNYDKSGIGALVSDALLATLQEADIFMINQEFPFGTTGEPAEDKQFTFRLHPKYVSVEQELGVDLVTLANNHVLDFGRSPLAETLDTLKQAGIPYVGAGADLAEASACRVFSLQDKTIGFLGASRVIPVAEWNAGKNIPGVFTTYDPAKLLEEIAKAKETCDFVVVYVHWGIERNTMPEDYQRKLGYLYIDAGADAVIGSHPHVVQGVEYYKGKPIVYSLGNFIFNAKTYDTMLAELTLKEDACVLRMIPCISEAGQVRLMENTTNFYQMLEGLSFDVTIGADGSILPKEETVELD